MPTPTVYIDGSAGTTGLRIKDQLSTRDDIELSVLPYDDRRDPAKRRAAIAGADLAILCLPDDAAVEAAAWASEERTKIIDASTAHRVADGWAYGLPEMDPSQRQKIKEADRWANTRASEIVRK